MSDREPENGSKEDDTAAKGPGAEGVRIIGADEAAAAIEAGQASGRRPDDAPRYGDVPPPPPGPRPSLTFPAPGSVPERGGGSVPERGAGSVPERGGGSERPTEIVRPPVSSSPSEPPRLWDPPAQDEPPRAQGSAAGSGTEEPASGPTVLPHWTEPPTGEVPRILPGSDDDPPEPPDDLGAWSGLGTATRWRDSASDWEKPDFNEGALLSDDETRVGALDSGRTEAVDDDPFALDAPVVERQPSQPTAVVPPVEAPAAGEPGGPSAEGDDEEMFGPSGPGAGRDLGLAVVSGLVIGALFLIAAKVGPAALLVLCVVALVMAAAELFGALQQRGFHPATLLGLVGTASLVAAAYWKGEQAFPLVLGLFVVFTMLWYLWGVVRARPALNVAVTLLGFAYVGFLGGFVGLLLGFPRRHGVAFLVGTILAVVAYDVSAYFVGSRIGRTPLAAAISPRKTWEGLIGASLVTFFVCVLLVGRIHPWTTSRAFVLFCVVVVMAPLGDLAESMIKRDLGVKDIGWILPGHGGILDRIDALLFVVPAVYYVVRILKIG